MLERPGEGRPPGREALQLLAVVPEPDDQHPGVEIAHSLEEHVDALVQEQLAEVEDRRPIALEERCEPFGIALVRATLVGVPGVGRVEPCLGEQIAQRRVARLRCELLDVDPRRHLVHAVDVADDLLQHRADVLRADEHGRRVGERLPPPPLEGLVAAHGGTRAPSRGP